MHTKKYWMHFEKVIKIIEKIGGDIVFYDLNSFTNFKYYQGEFTLYVFINAPSRLKGVDENKNNLGKEIKKLVDENK